MSMGDIENGKHSTRWRWIASIWLAIGFFDACQTVLFMNALDTRLSRLTVFVTEMVSWLPWALATSFIVDLARRYAITRRAIVRTCAMHLAAFVAVSVVAEVWFAALQTLYNPWDYRQKPAFAEALRMSLPYQLTTYLIVYALIIVITYVIDARDRMARQTTETARLRGTLESTTSTIAPSNRATLHVQHA